MSRSLPEMGSWDSVFDQTYLDTYLPSVNAELTRAEALGAASLAEVEEGAEILDRPTGFGRHAVVLAEAGYRVTALDRSPALLAEAEKRRGDPEWPRFVRGDYRELPFEDASFDAVFNLFSSLGYLERDEDVGVLHEFRRVLRPGGALIIETAHRDGFARFAQPFARRGKRMDEMVDVRRTLGRGGMSEPPGEFRPRPRWLERLRFTSSGTEATMFAIRAARAYTGRPLLAKFERSYHGTHDGVMTGTRGCVQPVRARTPRQSRSPAKPRSLQNPPRTVHPAAPPALPRPSPSPRLPRAAAPAVPDTEPMHPHRALA